MRIRTGLAMLACFTLLLAACGGGTAESTTTTAESSTATDAPSTTAPNTTAPDTTAPAETTTTAAGAPEASGDLSLLHAAMQTTTDTAPSRIEGVMRVSGITDDSGLDEVEMPFTISTDTSSGDSAFLMDFGAMFTAMGDTEEMPEGMGDLMGEMEFREIGDVTYMKFPFFSAFLGAETEWVSMPAEDGDDVADDMGPGTSPSDPSEILESFSDAEGAVEVVGDEEIRGIPTTHYLLLIDESWHEELSSEELAELEDQGFAAGTVLPLNLWIGEDGLVHRMSMELDAGQLEEGSDTDFESMTMTFDLFDFGESITIEPPPADQVTDMEDLAGGFTIPES